jgi:hypothetical protein
MNPYPDRINELHRFLAEKFGVTDEAAIDLLLASRLDTPLIHPPIVLETDYPARWTAPAWFSFGGLLASESIASMRVMRSRQGEEVVDRWLNAVRDGQALMLVESEWRDLPLIGNAGQGAGRIVYSSEYGTVLAAAVRVRTPYPKTVWSATALYRTDPAHDPLLQELRRLAERALDNSFRDQGQTMNIRPPANFLFWCEALQKLAFVQKDFDALKINLAAIAWRVAHLYGEPVCNWQAAERVMRDTVPWQVGEILRAAAAEEGWRIGRDRNRRVERETHRLAALGIMTGHTSGGWRVYRMNADAFPLLKLVDEKTSLFAA